MGRTFQYIQYDDVLKSFVEFRDSVLRNRPVVIARHGDYSLFLKYLSDDELGLTIENTEKHKVIMDRSYVVSNTTQALVARGVRHACQKMSELSDADVNRRRLQIWKWYVMDWQKANNVSAQELMEKELVWRDEDDQTHKEVMDVEAFLHGDYLNMGNTISLIERYMAGDVTHMEQFKKFAVSDIMEMTSEDTKDRLLAEAEERRQEEDLKKHTYRFVVSVEASDKEHARQALLNYLAGDDRIKVQK